MKDRIKWLLFGLGITFGLQAIISVLFTGVAYDAARSGTLIGQDLVLVIALGLVIGTFLIGGFVVGCVSAEMRMLDSVIIALSSIALNSIVYIGLPKGNKPQLVTGYLLNSAGRSGLFVGLAVVAALIGAYWGWRVSMPQERVFDRIVMLVALMGAVVGPFVLLVVGGADPNNPGQPSVPSFFVVTGLILMLVIVGVGFVLFSRESKRETLYEQEISISPEHHRPAQKSQAVGSSR